MLKLDHLVYFTKLTPAEIAAQQRAAGRHAVVGGSHLQWGTRNALLYTANGYIEWLSVENPEVAQLSDQLLTRLLLHDVNTRHGWGTLCFSTIDITALEEHIRKEGFSTSGVIRAQRATPDGRLIKWKMLFAETIVSDRLPLPFFIEWEEPEVLRFENLRKNKATLPSNEELKIKECTIGVADPEEHIARWAKLLPGAVAGPDKIEVHNVVLQFKKTTNNKERLSRVILQNGNDLFEI